MVTNLLVFQKRHELTYYLDRVLVGASCRVNKTAAYIEYTDGSRTYLKVLNTPKDMFRVLGMVFDSITFDGSCGAVRQALSMLLAHQLRYTAPLAPEDKKHFSRTTIDIR